MTGKYLTPDQVALIVVCVVLGALALGGLLSAVTRRGGR